MLHGMLVAAVLSSSAAFVGPYSPAACPSPFPFNSARVCCPRARMNRGISIRVHEALQGEAVQGDTPRHPIYWIDECEPHEKTRETAARSARNLPSFLAHKAVADYNIKAFRDARGAYEAYCAKVDKPPAEVPFVLDSCCGTGRSTWNLAAMRPDAFIVGVDKSLARLERNAVFRERQTGEEQGMGRGRAKYTDAAAEDDDKDHKLPPPRENMILLRANCIDFWRLIWESDLTVESHTILYPNPYPKPKQHTLRWHGQPAFPVLLYIGSSIEVRASWRTYLEEMALAVDEIRATGPLPIEQLFLGENLDMPLSNFEAKYVKAQQPIYRLRIPSATKVEAEDIGLFGPALPRISPSL
jgi:tRNA (guanine-N7-)-methyltransferase